MSMILAEDLHGFLQLMKTAKRAVYIKGPPGAGKSAQIKAFCRAQGPDYGRFVINGATANVADIIGYLMPFTAKHVNAAGEEIEVSEGRYTYMHWARDEDTNKPAYLYKRGCIVIEEWDKLGVDEKKALAQVIYERRVGEYDLGDFDIIMAGNRPEDNSGSVRDFDFLINRRTEITLVPTLKNFLSVANEIGMLPITMAFAARAGDRLNLFDSKVPEKQGPWLTQRSLHALDDIVQAGEAMGMSIDDPMILMAAAGTVGEGVAHEYVAFAKARSKIPGLSVILADPMGAPIPSELDVLMFLVFDLASKSKKENISAICKYVGRLPSDMGVAYFQSATQRDKSLVSTSEFSKFAVDNLTLLSAVAGRR